MLLHARQTTRALTDLLRAHRSDRLLLGGPQESIAVLRPKLPRPPEARFAVSCRLRLTPASLFVLQAMRHAADAVERRSELGVG